MTILFWWFLLVVWAVTLVLAARWGHKMGEAREKAGRLLLVMIGPVEFTVAGNLIRLSPGELFEARMWRRGLADQERAARLKTD